MSLPNVRGRECPGIMPGSTPESLPDARTHEARGVKAREVVPVRLPDASGREASGAGAARKARTTPESSGDIGREGRGSRSSGREGGARANPEDSLCIQLESRYVARLARKTPCAWPSLCCVLASAGTPPRLQPRKGEVKSRAFRRGSDHAAKTAQHGVNRARQGRISCSAVRSDPRPGSRPVHP